MAEVVLAVDAWITPNTPDIAREWPPELVHVLKLFKREEVLTGAPIEDILERMAKAGVERAILTAIDWPNFKISNDLVWKIIQKFPNQFIGCASTDPRRLLPGIKELEYAVKELGFKAFRLLPYSWRKPANDKMFYPFYAKCAELRIPVIVQVGHTAPLFPSDPGRPIYLDEVALDFPELTIVAAHLGWPWVDEMIAVAWKHPNVFVETSAHLPRHYPPQFVHFMRTFGQDKVLFASADPLLPLERCLGEIEMLGLPIQVRKKFLRDNAVKVFNLG